MHYTVWYKHQPDIYRETRSAGLINVRDYLLCDINWENGTQYPDKYVDFTFHNTEDELFYRLKWEITNEKTSIY
jgi:hypothetical protein